MATTKTIQPTGETITIPAMTDRPDASVFATDVSRITDAVNSTNQAISTLNSNLAPVNFTVAAGETVTKPISAQTILITGHLSVSTNLRGVYFIFGNSAVAPIVDASNLVVSVADGNVTITNNASGTCNCALIR